MSDARPTSVAKPNTEQAHAVFRGSAEAAKWLSTAAFSAELAAATIAVSGIWFATITSAWLPAIAFLFVLGSVAMRQFSAAARRIAEAARRASLSAYSLGIDVSPSTLSSLRSDSAWLAGFLARHLPAATLDAYYEPHTEPGPRRLKELVAHSAFVTWRLLRARLWILGAFTSVLSILVFLALYGLATGTVPNAPSQKILDTLCSVILGVLFIRSLEASLATQDQAGRCRIIADGLIERPIPTEDRLRDLVDEYNFAMVDTSSIPTVIYRIMRGSLADEWKSRREALTADPNS